MSVIVSAMLAAALQTSTITVPTGTAATPPEAPAVVDGDESPEEIAGDAARDLRESRFYNRPGATRAEYEQAWQECRLIARGSRTPTGAHTMVYNPNYVSPVIAGIAGGLGAALGAAIREGQLRRENRRSCLLIRGWRLVEVSDEERERVSSMSDAERNAHFSAIVGASDLSGYEVTSWNNDFAQPRLAVEDDR